MLHSWLLVFRMVTPSGLMMIINVDKAVVLVRVVATVVVLRHHIHLVVDRMVLEMEMHMRLIWEHYRHHHRAYSIPPQVNNNYFI